MESFYADDDPYGPFSLDLDPFFDFANDPFPSSPQQPQPQPQQQNSPLDRSAIGYHPKSPDARFASDIQFDEDAFELNASGEDFEFNLSAMDTGNDFTFSSDEDPMGLTSSSYSPQADELLPVTELVDLLNQQDAIVGTLITAMMRNGERDVSRKKDANSHYGTVRILTLEDVARLTATSQQFQRAIETTTVWRGILRAVVFGRNVFPTATPYDSDHIERALLSWENTLLSAWYLQLSTAVSRVSTTAEPIEIWRLMKRFVEHVIMIRKQLLWKREWNVPHSAIKGLQFGRITAQEASVALTLFPGLDRKGNAAFMGDLQMYYDGNPEVKANLNTLDSALRMTAQKTAHSMHEWVRGSRSGNMLAQLASNWCQLVSSHDDTDAMFYVLPSALFADTIRLGRIVAYDRKWMVQDIAELLPSPQSMTLPHQPATPSIIPIYPLFGDRTAVVNTPRKHLLVGVQGIVFSNTPQKQSRTLPNRQVCLDLVVWDRINRKTQARRLSDTYGMLVGAHPEVVVPLTQKLLSIHASRYTIVINFTNFVAIIEWDADSFSDDNTLLAHTHIHYKVWSSVLGTLANTVASPALVKNVSALGTTKGTKLPRQTVVNGTTKWTDMSVPVPTPANPLTMGDIWSGNFLPSKNMLRCATIALDPVHGRRFLALIFLASGITADVLAYPSATMLVWCEYDERVIDVRKRWRVYAHDESHKLALFATTIELDILKRRTDARHASGKTGRGKYEDLLQRRSNDWMRMSASHRFTMGSIFSTCASHLTVAVVTPIFFDDDNKAAQRGRQKADVLTLVTHPWEKLRALMVVSPQPRAADAGKTASHSLNKFHNFLDGASRVISETGKITTRIVVNELTAFWVSNIGSMPWVIVSQPAIAPSHDTMFLAEPGTYVPMHYNAIGTKLVTLRERLNIGPTLAISTILGFCANGTLLVVITQSNDSRITYVIPYTPDHELFPADHMDRRLLSSSALWRQQHGKDTPAVSLSAAKYRDEQQLKPASF